MASAPDVLDELRDHPHSFALCTRVSQIVLTAADRRQAEWLSSPEVAEIPPGQLLELTQDQAETSAGNLLEVLDRGATRASEWNALGAAVALTVSRSWSELPAAETLDQLSWLAAHTPCSPWLFLDACLEDARDTFWQAAADACDKWSQATQLAVAAGVISAASPPALAFKTTLADASESPVLRHLLQFGTPTGSLSGELVAGPSRPWVLVLKAVTGWLLVAGVGRLVARFVLGARQPAQLSISAAGLQIVSQRRMLGRSLGERTSVTPLAEVGSLSRETRFARAGLYAGLLALAVGSYLGSSMMLDGVRVPGGSPSLLGFGVLAVIVGLVLDLAFSALDHLRRGQTRLIIQTRQHGALSLRGLSADRVDEWLKRAAALRGLS